MATTPGASDRPIAPAIAVDGGAAAQPPLFTRGLLLLCSAAFFQMFSFQMLLPVVPLYMLDVGGSEAQVGLIFGVTAGTALLFRPLTGWVADRYGRKPLLLAGNLNFVLTMLLYPFARAVAPLLAVRSLQGAGLSAVSTAGSTMVADISPPLRRAEGMGVYGVAVNVSSAIGPLLGASLAIASGFTTVFVVSALIAVAGVILASRVPEPPRPPGPPGGPGFTLVSRDALFPAAIALCVFPPIGVVLSYIAVFADAEGLGNPGLFFLPYSLALIVVRVQAGRLADRYGRTTVLLPGVLALVCALAVIASANHMLVLLIGAVTLGVGFGIAHPTVLAMGVDRAPPGRQGASMGTLIGAFDLGIGGGATLAGIAVALAGLRGAFLLAIIAPLIGALLLIIAKRRGSR